MRSRSMLASCSVALVVAALMACAAPALADDDDTADGLSASVAPAAPASPVVGTWRTLDGTEITISPCAKGFCGVLSWVVVPAQYESDCEADKAAFGVQMLDYQNPDKGLQTRPILGMQTLTMKPGKDDRSFTASIYNPQEGKSYKVDFWVVNDDETLRLGGGCVGGGGFCAVTQDWPRVPDRPDAPDFSCR